MFLACRRGKQTVFLEPNEGDSVQTALEALGEALGRAADSVALLHQGRLLAPNKVLQVSLPVAGKALQRLGVAGRGVARARRGCGGSIGSGTRDG